MQINFFIHIKNYTAALFLELCSKIPVELPKYFKDKFKIFGKFSQVVMNAFKYSNSNGFLEGINNNIKVIKRGTTTQIKENNKPRQLYFAETGQAKYIENRKRCGANSKLVSAVDFINYACKQIIDFNWSPDAIVGFVKSLRTWDKPLVSTKTLYNYIDKGFLPIRNHHLKMKLRLSSKKKKVVSIKKN